jgi:gamma-glutamyltranspeptidase/glutathione hydrolase
MTEFSYAQPYPVHRVPVLARNIVATSQPLAAQAGMSMLLKGGNAVDAALAAATTLTVVEPTANGLGSDAFAIVWDGKALHGLNGSGRSPAGWTPARFAGLAEMPATGWESVTVPGAVSTWAALSERFGRLAFEDLAGPAIGYARDGFPVSPTIARAWAAGAAQLAEQPGFRETFMPGGRAPKAGEIFRNPAQARSLEAIARTKGEAFYHGELAERIAAAAAAHGAVLSRDDLAAHEADWCGTLSTEVHGTDLHELPPNGQGIAALIALGILEHTEIAELDPDGAQAKHLQIEAMKLSFADVYRFVADREAMRMPPEAMLDRAYLARRAALIDRNRTNVPQAGLPKPGGTIYVTAADASGMMVSLIQSNYGGFGSGVVVPGTGIHLQNRGSGFSIDPGHPNRVGPRKRPFHTIIPGFLMRGGAPAMSFGVVGGPMQPQAHVQLVQRMLLHGQNPQAAIDAPRWRILAGRHIAVEWAVPDTVVERLRGLGHEVQRESPGDSFAFGCAQAIHRLADGYVAGSDNRRDGLAIGL